MFVQELAKRTLANYQFIKNNLDQDKLFEVTQLINSMYCLLVVPEEIFGIRRQDDPTSSNALKTKFSTRENNLKKYKEYHSVYSLLENLKKQNRIFYSSIGAFESDYPICSFLYNLRNSLCHEGIGFLPFQTDYAGKLTTKIDNIIFESRNKNDRILFLAVLSVEQLETLLFNVSAMYSRVEAGKSNSNTKEYLDFYKKIIKDVTTHLPNLDLK